MVSFKTVCHHLNLVTPEYDDANSIDDACDDKDDALSELLAAMSPCSSEEEQESVSTCPVSDNDEDEESSEEDEESSEYDENWYEEQNHDIDSVAIPVNTTELFNFPAMQLVTLLNHPVLVKDAHHQLCIAHFGYRVYFINVNEDQKRALYTAISTTSVIVKPHPSSFGIKKINRLQLPKTFLNIYFNQHR